MNWKFINRKNIELLLFFLLVSFGRYFESAGLLLWMLHHNKISCLFDLRGKKLLFFAYIVIVSLIAITLQGYPYSKFGKELLVIFLYVQIYYAFVKYYNGRYEQLFDAYMKIAFAVAVVGVTLFVFTKITGIGIQFANQSEGALDEGLRARAWFAEPSYYSCFLLPAVIYSICKKGLLNKQSLFFIFAGYLAFSPVFKVLVFIFVIYYLYAYHIPIKQKLLVFSVCIVVLLLFKGPSDNNSYSANNESSMKLNETIESLRTTNIYELENVNASTYSLLKNLRIAMISNSRIFGTGLGTHEYNHDKLYKSNFELASLNREDGYSLGVRVFSELGIVGIFVFIIILIKGLNKASPINLACASYIIYCFLRGGHYTFYGLQLFIMLFLFTSKYNKNYVSNNCKTNIK